MTSDTIEDFLKAPRYTMIVNGRHVLTVDGARALLASFPRPELGDPIAELCERKVSKAEEFKRTLLFDGGRKFDQAVDRIIALVDNRLKGEQQ
jgi:hypothetical protein